MLIMVANGTLLGTDIDWKKTKMLSPLGESPILSIFTLKLGYLATKNNCLLLSRAWGWKDLFEILDLGTHNTKNKRESVYCFHEPGGGKI